MSCFLFLFARRYFFRILDLRRDRGRNRNPFFQLLPCVAGIALIKDRRCNRPQANSTVLSAKIRIGLLVRTGPLSIHLRSPIKFVPHPFGMGCQEVSRLSAAARWRRNTSA